MRSSRGARSRPIGSPDYREPVLANHGPGGPSSDPIRPTLRSRIPAAAAVVIVALALAAPAGATLRDRLQRALVADGVSRESTGAFAFDLVRSRIVYSQHRSLSLRPASNEKLTVAVTVLDRLGPGFRIPTQVLGQGTFAPDGVWHGRLVLKGYGNPSLDTRRLVRLAERIRASGIREVTGAIVGDESFFDKQRVAPGWKASYYKEECPPLSALIVDRARIDGYISSDPARAAATLFKRALRHAGVAVPGRVVKDRAPADAAVLAQVSSPTTARLVRRMDLVSDNFYAEMLLKQLGARFRDSGSTAGGARVVRTELRHRGVTMTGVRIVDGSGLSAYDRLTARAVTELLISAVTDDAIRTPFVASLPIAGVSGTLEDRMTSPPAYRHVYAKTGTTDRASALSGYVTNSSLSPRYVFGILMNGNPIPWWYARDAQDRFARVLARAAQ
jgi:serine-type D-Ala-D-Ala carboxypeptidase/endopeptidase (penicillin-binding protein 4)